MSVNLPEDVNILEKIVAEVIGVTLNCLIKRNVAQLLNFYVQVNIFKSVLF